MASLYLFARYPTAPMYDASHARVVKELIWGDCVQVTGPPRGPWLPVFVEDTEAFVHRDSLQEDRLLALRFLSLGRGDACLITTPDDRTVLVDASDGDDVYRFMRGMWPEWQRKLDAAIITRPNRNHSEGFRKFFEDKSVQVKALYHSGVVVRSSQSASRALGRRHGGLVTDLVQGQGELSQFLTKARSRESTSYSSLLKTALTCGRIGAVESLDTHRPFVPRFGKGSSVRLEVVGPVVERIESRAGVRWFGSVDETKEGNAVALRLCYGDIRVLLGGEFSRQAQERLFEHFAGSSADEGSPLERKLIVSAQSHLQSEVVKLCCHARPQFSERFLAALDPRVVVLTGGGGGDDSTDAAERREVVLDRALSSARARGRRGGQVFISYAHEQIKCAQGLADALRGEGWTVWWDANLYAGDPFSTVLEEKLRDADAVLVLWSREAVVSKWVLAEAAMAVQGGTYIPLQTDETLPPKPFESFHASSVRDWNGAANHPAFVSIARQVAERLGKRFASGDVRPLILDCPSEHSNDLGQTVELLYQLTAMKELDERLRQRIGEQAHILHRWQRELFARQVAIHIRTDGKRLLVAKRLDRPREGSLWELYAREPGAAGGLSLIGTK